MGLCSLSAIYLGPNYGGGNEGNVTSFKRSRACTAPLSAPTLLQASAHRRPTPLLETPGHSQARLGHFEHRCIIIFLNLAFSSFKNIPRSRLARSYGNFTFNVLKDYHIIFHSSCPILYSHWVTASSSSSFNFYGQAQ